MQAKTCGEILPNYAEAISDVSWMSTYARSVLATDRPEALKVTRDYEAAEAKADHYASIAANACPKGTNFEELIAASRQFGATKGRWDAYGHYAGKPTPPRPSDRTAIRTIQKNYTPEVVEAGRRRWNAINAIAPQPIPQNGGITPKL